MPTVEARVPTDRASRYVVQFCRHAGQMGRMGHRPPARHGGGTQPTVEHADWSDTIGTVRFSQGRCTMWADPDTLTLRVDATDEDTLQRLQDGITRRLETIGRRDHLTVHWRRSDLAPGLRAEETASATPASRRAAGKRRRSRLSALGWVAAAALAVVVHLGLLGGGLAASVWGKWGANAILAIILVKVLFVGVHLVAGGAAFRHGTPSPRRRKLRHSPSEPAPTSSSATG